MRLAKPAVLFALFALAACHHTAAPKVSVSPENATPQMLDSLWKQAMTFYDQHKWQKAATVFDRLELELPPGDRRAMIARMYLGELYVRDGSYLQGVREYRRLVDEFPTDSLAPEALLRSGDAYKALWRAPDLDPTYGITAQASYTELLTRYPASPAAGQAKARLQQLEDWFAIKDYKMATYYLKLRGYEAAVLGLKNLVIDYPGAAIVPTALADLIGVYRKLGYAEDIKDKCAYMKTKWSATPQFAKACPELLNAAPEKPAGS